MTRDDFQIVGARALLDAAWERFSAFWALSKNSLLTINAAVAVYQNHRRKRGEALAAQESATRFSTVM